jgi:hypothetical protein
VVKTEPASLVVGTTVMATGSAVVVVTAGGEAVGRNGPLIS